MDFHPEGFHETPRTHIPFEKSLSPSKKGLQNPWKKQIGIRQNKVDIVLFSEVKSDTEQGARQGTRNPIKEIRSGIKLKRIYL